MEQPPFLHHPPRCVPLPHHPPPPPTQNLSEDLNFYRQNRHLVPLPLPLPPPYRLLALPPSPPRLTYNHQSHFPFPNHRPIDDDLRIPHLLLEPPRLCNRRPPEFDLLQISCPDSWMDPHKVRPDNQIQFSPFPTADNLRHDLVSSLRNDFTDSGFIPDNDDVFLRNPITDHHGSDLDSSYGLSRDRYESNSSGSSRNFAFGDSHVSSPKKSRDFGSTVGSYQSFRGFVLGSDRNRSNCGDENRWGGHTRPPSINSDDTCPVDAENNGFIDANGPRVGSSRRAPHVYDSGKHNYRASREGNREFRHSRRKEMERTSALLRIKFGKSNKRNRNGEQKFPSLCSNDSGPSTFRSRGPIVHTDIRVEEDGERSPVELDVSFKSNALVAKAIVASPTHEAESTRNLIRNGKLSGPEIDHSKTPPNKSNSSTHGFDCPAISYKESNHSGGNNKDTGGRDVCGIVSQPSSHHTTELPGRNTLKKPVSDKGVGTVGSVGSSSRRIKKMRVNSQVLRSQAKEKNVDLVEEDCRTNCSPKASLVGEDNTHLGEKHPSSGMAMVQNVDMQPSRKEVTAFLDHIIANYTATAIVSSKDESGGNSGGSDVHNSKKPRNSFTHPCSSLNPVPINSDEGTVIAVTSADLQTISNYAKGPAELQNGSTLTGSGHGSHRSCQNEPPVLLQNSFSKGYFEANDISSPEEIRNHGVPVHLRTSSHDLHNGSSDNGLIRGQLKNTVSDMDAVGTDFKCTEATVLVESVEVKGFPRAVPSVESNSIVSLSSAVETNIQEGVLGYGSNGSAIPTSGSYKLLSNSQSKFPVSGIGFLGDTNKGPGPDSATVSLAKIALEGAPKVTMAVGGDLHAGFGVGCTSNKGKDISYPLPSPSSGDMTTFTILDPVDTTSSYSSVDLNFAEEDVMGAGNFSAGSQSYTDMDAVATDCKCTETTVLVESVEVKGFPRAVPLVESNSIVSLSGAVETNIQVGVHGDGSNSSAIPTSGSYEHLSNSRSKFPVSGIGFLGDTNKGSGPDSTPVLAIVALEGAPKVTMAVGGDLHTGFGVGCTSNKGKDISYPLPSPSTSDMTTFTILDPVDTALSYSSVDLNFAEDDVLGAGNFSAGSQSCTDKDRIVHGYSPTKGSFDTDVLEEASFRIGYNGASTKYTKKRKISAPVSPSPMLSETQEESTNAGTYTLGAELLSHRGMVSNIHVGSSRFPSCPESCPVLLGNSEAGASFEAVGFAGEGLCRNVQKEKRDLVMTKVNPQIGILDTEIGGRGNNSEEPAGMLQIEIVQQRNPVGIQAPERDQSLPLTDMECESDLVGINGLPSVSNSLSLYEHDNSVSTSDLQDEIMESAPVKPSNVDSTKTVSTVTESKIVNAEMMLGQVLNGKGYEDERKQDEKLMRKDLCLSNFLNTSLQDTTFDNKPGHAMGSVSSINTKLGPQDARETNHGLHSLSGAVSMRKNLLASAAPSVFPGHLLKRTVSASHITKPRTWRRSTDSSVPPQGQPAAKIGKDQTAAYIRKGNSLVRKPSPFAAAPTVSHGLSSSVYRLNPPPVDEIKDRTGLDGTLERPNTPPLPCSTKLSNSITSSPLADPPLNGCFEIESDLLTLKLYVDMPKPSDDVPNSTGPCENQIGQINNSVSQSVQDDRNSVSREAKKVVYVKRKSNQLVAASGSSDLSHQKVDQIDAPTSNGYYKRRKNQIIRKPLKITQKVSFPDDMLSSEGKNALPVIASSSSRKRSGKGLAKTTKPSKSSLVWTLRGTESLTKENTRIHQVWPHLFPWKRATYRRSLMHTAASISTSRSLSTISQKLLLSRKRETIYTRSTQGFSLRKSKVLSVGGASLKWSKSIERTLNKANEEATLAVVAVEKKKREQNGAGAVTAGAKSRNRPSHEELSNTAATQPGIKKADVPKRLHIGNDEYVRIGNGNQLIRHPKRRTRILASEKVRWSLHNARLRLAKKKKYCQFFTRFGKCDKDDGKCPYIHDPSKIAVCTKFLKGSCSDINCKLTHKVIPERMQDCSYFLQGLCTNESCPYRHVNVKPNASICEGFLRGYCADGNECRKKHSYVCPTFEATGNCALGSKCKLHHPKSRSKGKKRNSSKEEKNSRARYFGSKHFDISDSGTAVSGKHCANDNDDIFYHQGRFADYIDLGFCYEEAGEINDSVAQQMTTAPGNVGHMDIQQGGDDELIKPIYLMIRSRMIDSPPTTESPSENTAEEISFK